LTEDNSLIMCAERIVGSYDWNRITQERKNETVFFLQKLVNEIVGDFAGLRELQIGDAWSITEERFMAVINKWHVPKVKQP